MKNEKAFTLAEVLIVLSVLGVVAMLTVPSLVKNQTQKQNETRLKKAAANFEALTSNFVVENGITSSSQFNISTIFGDNCKNAGNYFKIVDTINNDNCFFKTSDGLSWHFMDNSAYGGANDGVMIFTHVYSPDKVPKPENGQSLTSDEYLQELYNSYDAVFVSKFINNVFRTCSLPGGYLGSCE